jgi:hypothetical protein
LVNTVYVVTGLVHIKWEDLLETLLWVDCRKKIFGMITPQSSFLFQLQVCSNNNLLPYGILCTSLKTLIKKQGMLLTKFFCSQKECKFIKSKLPAKLT